MTTTTIFMFLFRNVNQKGIKALMSCDKKLANELLEDIDSIARYTLDEESLTTIMVASFGANGNKKRW